MSTLSVDTIQGKTTAGTVAMPSGHVVQSAFNNTELFTSSTSSTYADLIKISFTPKFSNSFLFINVFMRYQCSGSVDDMKIKVLHDSTNIFEVERYTLYTGGSNQINTVSFQSFVSSTGSTSSRDIKFQTAVYTGSQSVSINVNNSSGTATSMFIQEIAQ